MLCTLLSLKTEKRGHKPSNVVHLQKLEKAGKIATSIPVLEKAYLPTTSKMSGSRGKNNAICNYILKSINNSAGNGTRTENQNARSSTTKCKGSSIKMYLFFHFRVKIIEYSFKAKNGVLI